LSQSFGLCRSYAGWSGSNNPRWLNAPQKWMNSLKTDLDLCEPLLVLAKHYPRLHLFNISNFYRATSLNYTVSQKNVPPLACYIFVTHERILILFSRNVTDKVSNQKTLYYATSSNLCFCTTWQNGETRKSHFSLNWTVLHAQCTCALSS